MRIVIQRVLESNVKVEGQIIGQVGKGMMILVGVEPADTIEDIVWLSNKIVNLRIFDDEEGVMNKSIIDIAGDILLVSQFTLHASTKKRESAILYSSRKARHRNTHVSAIY